MAERVVNLLVETLEAWIKQEVELLRGVSDEIKDIKDEFESTRAFLCKADAMMDTDEQMKVWVKQVSEVAYEMENVLSEYILAHHENNGDQDVPGRHGLVSSKGIFQGFAGPFKRRKFMPTEHDIATRINAIKKKVTNISERRHRYEMNISFVPIPANNLRDPREDALFLDESQIVGIDGPRKILIDFLLKAHKRLGVISVYGMGGLGKTTLARKVYEASIEKMEFSLHAWITVSEKFNAKNLLRDLYIQLFGRVEGLDEMELLKLKQEISRKLKGRRYLVVLDDIWQTGAWKGFRNALPNDNNSRSRIIITTRSKSIAEAAGHGGVSGRLFPLEPLNAEDSWKLFSKKVAISSSNQPHVPTEELKERATKFLEKCKGLPLGLVAIGGLLSTKPLGEWEETYERFNDYMDKSGLLHSDEVDDMRLVISFSYNELPRRFKSCFLYLSYFPEDHSINCSKLFRMWSAEGCLVDKDPANLSIEGYLVHKDQANLSIEELAKPYLDELIQRSLVQVDVVNLRKRVVTCKVHDLIRDFIISEVGNRQDRSSHVRVLYVDHLSHEDVKGVSLSYLRYLSFSSFSVKGVNRPPNDLSIGKYKHLETLDLRGHRLNSTDLGGEILQLTQLRNLLTGTRPVRPATSLPAGIHRLQKLERLSLVSLHSRRYPREERDGKGFSCNELGMLTQLRKLSVGDLTEDDEIELFGSIQKMQFLKTFKVAKSAWYEDTFLHAHKSFSFPPSLQCLFMTGKLEQFPPWISSLRNLESLLLLDLHASNKFMESLEALPNLVILKLGGCGYGDKLRFSSTGFPRLRKLDLVRFSFNLITVEVGAMPEIRSLSIERESSVLIEGLSYLTTLEEIIIPYLSNSSVPHLENYSWQQGHNPKIVQSGDLKISWPFGYIRHCDY